MAGNAQRIEPKATVELNVPGVSASSVSGITITLRVGSWASGSISFHPKDAEGKATKVFSSDVSKVLGQIQKQGFSDRTQADAAITLTDGNGGTLKFPGLVTSPSYRMQPGNLDRTMDLVHEAALIDGIKTGIYNWPGVVWAYKAKSVTADSWSRFILNAYNFLYDNGRQDWRNLSAVDREITAQAHSNNASLHKIWGEILTASEATTKSNALSKLVASGGATLSPHINGIGRTLLAYLTASREGFWATINQICSAFQLVYVPPTTSAPYGHLIRLQEVLKSEPIGKELPILSCSYKLATDSVLPLQQVIVRSGGQSIFAFSDTKTNQPRAIVVWPKSATRTTGQVLYTTVPTWLLSTSSLDPNEKETSKITLSPPGTKDEVDINAYKGKNEVATKVYTTADTLLVEFLEEYAQALYIDRCLAGSTFTASTPLDLTWEPGERYTITSGGEQLFTGFLSQVTHSASVEPGNGQASTRLDFTHVELGDFKLSGVN